MWRHKKVTRGPRHASNYPQLIHRSPNAVSWLTGGGFGFSHKYDILTGAVAIWTAAVVMDAKRST